METRGDSPATDRAERSALLALLAARKGDALMVNWGSKLADDPSELLELAIRSKAEGWRLVALDLALDTGSSEAEAMLHGLHATVACIPASNEPLPPDDLLWRVSGLVDARLFDGAGKASTNAMVAAVAAAGGSVDTMGRVLDFGCGSGRILRHLPTAAPQAHPIAGCDIDSEAIDWVKANLRWAQADATPSVPPLPYPDSTFDLIVSWSVFTHLEEARQDCWLEELRRVTRPGGFVVATVNGDLVWRSQRGDALANHPDISALEARLHTHGMLGRNDDDWDAVFPAGYIHTAFHTSNYIQRRWAEWFDVLSVISGRAGTFQDLVVLRRRPA